MMLMHKEVPLKAGFFLLIFIHWVLAERGDEIKMFDFHFFPVSIIPSPISICPFFSLPKKRRL